MCVCVCREYVCACVYICGGVRPGEGSENPFGTDKCDLPLEEFCEKIEKDCAGIVKAYHRIQQDFPCTLRGRRGYFS